MERDNIRAIEALGVDMAGFIFYPRSPRYVARVPDYLPVKASRVGVFVDEREEEILRLDESFHFDYVQLHGHETPRECASLRDRGFKLIKALGIAGAESFGPVHEYEESCDLFLFDTAAASYGGSGRRFDWELLASYTGSIPFLLSGGIGPDDAAGLRGLEHPWLAGFDLNSRFEVSPGLKDPSKISVFLNNLIK